MCCEVHLFQRTEVFLESCVVSKQMADFFVGNRAIEDYVDVEVMGFFLHDLVRLWVFHFFQEVFSDEVD